MVITTLSNSVNSFMEKSRMYDIIMVVVQLKMPLQQHKQNLKSTVATNPNKN